MLTSKGLRENHFPRRYCRRGRYSFCGQDLVQWKQLKLRYLIGGYHSICPDWSEGGELMVALNNYVSCPHSHTEKVATARKKSKQK